MGYMKEIYIDLYYNTDGNIPLEYDLDEYLYKISEEQKLYEEYENNKKTPKNSNSISKNVTSAEKTSEEKQ